LLPNNLFFKQNPSFTISNEQAYNIPPKTVHIINFNILVQTSIPAVCILWGDPILRRKQLFFNITTIRTNDDYLSIKIFNNNPHEFFMPPFSIQINVHTVVGSLPDIS